jgi:hypothetical protein
MISEDIQGGTLKGEPGSSPFSLQEKQAGKHEMLTHTRETSLSSVIEYLDKGGIYVKTPFGPVSINRQHTKDLVIKTNRDNYQGQSVSDTYKDIIAALRKSGKSDPEIAKVLLDENKNNDAFEGFPLAQNAAAKLYATTNISEEWRKKGAAKWFRAVLRTIEEDGKLRLDKISNYFEFATEKGGAGCWLGEKANRTTIRPIV